MKTSKFYLLFVIAMTLTALVSCKKDDDDDDTPDNYFAVDGKNYGLSKGYLLEFGDNGNGSFDFDVYLVSDNMEYNSVSGDFIGAGEVIYIDFNTSSPNGMISGTYNFSNTRNAFTFVDGIAGISLDLVTQQGTLFQIAGGSIDVVVDGLETEFIYDLTTINNKKVTGRFKGNLTEI